jgi:hypothetical protein
MKVEIKVVEVAYARGVALVACDLISGDLKSGLKLKKETSGEEWTLLGLSAVSPDLYSQGRRGVSLSPSTHGARLDAGDHLTAE